MNKVVKNFLKLVVGLSILFIVFYRIGFGDIWETLKSVNLWVLLPTFCLQILFVIFGGLASWILFKPISKLGYFEFLKYYALSWTIGLFVPGKIGEASIIYFLNKKKISIGKGTAIFVMEKFISLIVIGIIASFGLFILFTFIVAIKLFGLLVTIMLFGLFLILSRFGRNLVKKIFLRKFQGIFKGFSKTIFKYSKEHKRIIVLSSLFTFLRWIVASYIFYLIFLLGFDISITFYNLLMIYAIGTIIALIPISINGLGIREAILVYLYGLIGIAHETVASAAIISLTLTYLSGFCIWAIWSWKK